MNFIYKIFTFLLLCSLLLSFEVTAQPRIVVISNASAQAGGDYHILPSIDGYSPDFSIDGGVTWFKDPYLESVGSPGDRLCVLIRYQCCLSDESVCIDLPSCIDVPDTYTATSAIGCGKSILYQTGELPYDLSIIVLNDFGVSAGLPCIVNSNSILHLVSDSMDCETHQPIYSLSRDSFRLSKSMLCSSIPSARLSIPFSDNTDLKILNPSREESTDYIATTSGNYCFSIKDPIDPTCAFTVCDNVLLPSVVLTQVERINGTLCRISFKAALTGAGIYSVTIGGQSYTGAELSESVALSAGFYTLVYTHSSNPECEFTMPIRIPNCNGMNSTIADVQISSYQPSGPHKNDGRISVAHYASSQFFVEIISATNGYDKREMLRYNLNVANLLPGIYKVRITDVCSGGIRTETINLYNCQDPIQMHREYIDVEHLCLQSSDPVGQIKVSLPYWLRPASIIIAGDPTAFKKELTEGSYSVHITDVNGCVSTHHIAVTRAKEPTASFIKLSTDNSTCEYDLFCSDEILSKSYSPASLRNIEYKKQRCKADVYCPEVGKVESLNYKASWLYPIEPDFICTKELICPINGVAMDFKTGSLVYKKKWDGLRRRCAAVCHYSAFDNDFMDWADEGFCDIPGLTASSPNECYDILDLSPAGLRPLATTFQVGTKFFIQDLGATESQLDTAVGSSVFPTHVYSVDDSTQLSVSILSADIQSGSENHYGVALSILAKGEETDYLRIPLLKVSSVTRDLNGDLILSGPYLAFDAEPFVEPEITSFSVDVDTLGNIQTRHYDGSLIYGSTGGFAFYDDEGYTCYILQSAYENNKIVLYKSIDYSKVTILEAQFLGKVIPSDNLPIAAFIAYDSETRQSGAVYMVADDMFQKVFTFKNAGNVMMSLIGDDLTIIYRTLESSLVRYDFTHVDLTGSGNPVKYPPSFRAMKDAEGRLKVYNCAIDVLRNPNLTSDKATYTLSPSPAVDLVNVPNEYLENITSVVVIDNLGSSYPAVMNTHGQVDIAALKPGHYLLKLHMIDGTQVALSFVKAM